MRATFIRHHNHNQFRLIRWEKDNGRTEPSQGNNCVRNIQWMVKEVIHNNDNEFLATKMQSGITIRAMSDGSYHHTHQYGTSNCIIKIQNNDGTITGANVVPSDTKYQCYHHSEICGIIGDIRHINNIFSIYNVLEIS